MNKWVEYYPSSIHQMRAAPDLWLHKRYLFMSRRVPAAKPNWASRDQQRDVRVDRPLWRALGHLFSLHLRAFDSHIPIINPLPLRSSLFHRFIGRFTQESALDNSWNPSPSRP
jgi:hypothetical protein